MSVSKGKWIWKHWQKCIGFQKKNTGVIHFMRSTLKKISSIHCISEIKICKDTNKTIYQGCGRSLVQDPSYAEHTPGDGVTKPQDSVGTRELLLQGLCSDLTQSQKAKNKLWLSRVFSILETEEQRKCLRGRIWCSPLSLTSLAAICS